MSTVKVKMLRNAVISAKVNGLAGDVLEVGADEARNLFHAGAARPATEEAKPKTTKKAK